MIREEDISEVWLGNKESCQDWLEALRDLIKRGDEYPGGSYLRWNPRVNKSHRDSVSEELEDKMLET